MTITVPNRDAGDFSEGNSPFQTDRDSAKRPPPSEVTQFVTHGDADGETSLGDDFELDDRAASLNLKTTGVSPTPPAAPFSCSPNLSSGSLPLSSSIGRGSGNQIAHFVHPMLGEYELIQLIGSGGMGQVFKARHRTMERLVALKVLPKRFSDSEELVTQFYEEVRAVAKLMHPNIVTAFDAGRASNVHYLVMELIEGQALNHRVAERGPLSVNEAVTVLRQVATALAFAHSRGIVHRDIKPGNIMLTLDGTVKLLDFGLAQLGPAVAGPENRKILLGTVEYMSPEQIEKPGSADQRSDLYSLGASLFYLLTGRPMFEGDMKQVVTAQLRQIAPHLYTVRPDADYRLDSVFQRLVAKDPNARFQSGRELLEKLTELNLVGNPVTTLTLDRQVDDTNSVEALANAGTRFNNRGSTYTQKSQAIGIDLGMAHSSIAYCDAKNGPTLIDIPGSGTAIRNMIWSDGTQIAIGADAITKRHQSPEQMFHSLQQMIGLKQLGRPFGGEMVPPEVLIGAVLSSLNLAAQVAVPGANQAVITVPGCYDQLRRKSIMAACQIAGVEVLQLLDKPLAAGLAWAELSSRLEPKKSRESLKKKASGEAAAMAQGDALSELASAALRRNPLSAEQILLIVHIGGAAMEASIVSVADGVVRLLSTVGDWVMGQSRWQHRLTDHLANMFREKTGIDVRQDLIAATRLQRTVEMSLDRLGQGNKVDMRFEANGQSIQLPLTRQMYVSLTHDLLSSLTEMVRGAVKQSGIDPTEIDQALFVGGLSRITEIRDASLACLPHKPVVGILSQADLARGAAIQAESLEPSGDHAEDLPQALSSIVYDIAWLVPSGESGKLMPRVLIPKGGEVPLEATRSFRSAGTSRRGTKIQLIEGTRLGGSNWHHLATVAVEELFPNLPTDERLQLKLQIDASGILYVQLDRQSGGCATSIPLLPEATLTAEQIRHWSSWLTTLLLCGGQ